MRILVLGSRGMAGHMITAYLRFKNFEVYTASRDVESDFIIDIENKYNTEIVFKDIIANKKIDFIINCIGILVSDQYKNVARTVYVNSFFPKLLEETFINTDTNIIHISTDCVFNGKRGYYIESDLPNETNLYGRSKALGEINNDKDLTIRTSIIGTELKNGSGLLNWLLKTPEKEVSGWTNAYWNGITTLELAKAIEAHIVSNSVTGLYHLVNNDYYLDKCALLEIINEVFDCNKIINPVELKEDSNKMLVDTRDIFPFVTIDQASQLYELKEFAYKHNLMKNYP